MNKREISKIIRITLKEMFDKSEDVSPRTVNNLQGNEALVLTEPYQLTDESSPDLFGDPVTDFANGKVKLKGTKADNGIMANLDKDKL